HENAARDVAERLGRRLRRRFVVCGRVADGQRAAPGVYRQRRAQRLLARLAVDLDGVAARRRPERDAAAVAVRRRERAGACAACALLAESLRAGHRDLAAGESGRGAPAAGVQLGARRLVDERHVELLAEDLLVEIDGAGLADVRSRLLRHRYASLLIRTTDPFGP